MKTKGPMGKRVSADENQSTRTVGMYWVDKTLNLVKEIEADRTVKEAMDDVAAALGAHIYTTYKMTKSVPDWNDVAADFVCYPFVEPDTKLCDLPPHTGIGSNEEDLTILLRPKLASPMISAFIPLRLENAKLRGGLLVPVGPPSVEDTSPSLRDLMKEIDNLKTARDDDQKQRTEDRIEHATEISRLERQYATDISRAERQHATDISRLEKQHATETARLEKQRTEDRVERATEISRLEGQHATEIARLERQHATKISVLEKKNQDLEIKMAEHAMTVEEVKRSTLMVAPLHLRVLLDDAREMIVGKSSFTSWEALWRSFGDDHHLTPAYVQGIAPALTLEACRLICFTTDVRLHGNQSAHTASPADVRSAILQRSFGNERSMLQQIFRVVYDQQI